MWANESLESLQKLKKGVFLKLKYTFIVIMSISLVCLTCVCVSDVEGWGRGRSPGKNASV